ncbi:MAG: hypothetical protein K6G36_00335 [Candidatus Saccharibacteria bacterium]|nr:hypothetical protein [Candidatus Saccharibacteria bacterium]
MSAEETLKLSEENALQNGDHFSSVTGKNLKIRGSRSAKSSTGVIFALLGFAVIGIFLLGRSDSIISDLNDRLVAQTDVQRADASETKKIVLAESLKSGNFPSDTAENLKEEGYRVGFFDDAGNFVESNQSNKELAVEKDGEIIYANEFAEKANSDAALHKAIDKATYGATAYYYDDAAQKVFKELGVSRNNYANNEEFETVMKRVLGQNTEVDINTATKATSTDSEGNTYSYFQTSGNEANSRYQDAEKLVSEVASKNPGASTTDATLATADTLKVADTINKEQRSSRFYVAFMESISKTKAGQGDKARINEAMNYLHKTSTTQVVDTATGELIEVEGSPLESPSLLSILTGSEVDKSVVKNYSSDRILNIAANKLNLTTASTRPVASPIISAISKTVTSVANRFKTTIGRIFGSGKETADTNILRSITPTVASSLNDTSLPQGIDAGELLVEGAVNVGRKLAIAGSGATAGDADAVLAYQKEVKNYLALEAAADRLDRSPFDISSPNTFLGSLVREFASILKPISLTSAFTSLPSLAGRSIANLVTGGAYADSANTYLTTYGNCDTHATIDIVGTSQCSTIATFDSSTLNAFDDDGFSKFVEQNTVLENGVRSIKPTSALADFILYNDERQTPLGSIDGGILSSLKKRTSNIPFISDILSMLEDFSDASDSNLRMASGAAFANTKSNSDWQNYKYAQRYVSIARATAALRQYSTDTTAYQNLRYFEGAENPVIAFLKSEAEIETSLAKLP